MPLHHTDDPGVRAAHAAEHAAEKTWRETGDFRQYAETLASTYQETLRESVPDHEEFPPCPYEHCESFGSSGRVGPSGIGRAYYCYDCCGTFD